jgi:hypothetical protein
MTVAAFVKAMADGELRNLNSYSPLGKKTEDCEEMIT